MNWRAGVSLLQLVVTAVASLAVSAEPRTGTDRDVHAPVGRSPSARLATTVFCTVSYDSQRRDHVYEYSIRSSAGNAAAVDLIGLREVGPHYGVAAPAGWETIEHYQDAPNSLVWVAVGADQRVPEDLSFLSKPPPSAVSRRTRLGFPIEVTRAESSNGATGESVRGHRE